MRLKLRSGPDAEGGPSRPSARTRQKTTRQGTAGSGQAGRRPVDNDAGPGGTHQAQAMDFRALYHLAAGQQGVFTRAQAAQAGASAYQVRSRVNRGEWVVVLGDVLAVAGLPLTQRVREAAALLELPGTVLGGPSAAYRYGLVAPGERVF